MADKPEKDEESSATTAGEVLEIPLREVMMFKEQPRKFFDQEKIRRLGQSIKRRGQITPIRVRRLLPEERKAHPGKFWQAIDGQRRYMACELIKRPTIRAEVVTGVDSEKDKFVDSLVANFNREGHTPLETAEAMKRLKDFGFSVTEIAELVGCSDCTVYEHLHLLNLDPKILPMMRPSIPEKERLPFMVAKRLATFPVEHQKQLIGQVAGITGAKARHVMESYARKHKIEKPKNTNRWSPRKNWAIFRGFIRRLEETSGIFADKPGSHYDDMLEFRDVGDIAKAMKSLEESLARLRGIKEVLAQREEKKRRGISLISRPAPKPATVKQEPAGKDSNGNGNGKKPKKPEKPLLPTLTPGQLQDRKAHETAMQALGRKRQIEEEARRVTAEEAALRAAAEEAARETPKDQARALRDAMEWGGKRVKPETHVKLASPLGRPKFRDPLIDG